jgi:cation diffusion facilitator CzcD-associated flavoprotein CzcO
VAKHVFVFQRTAVWCSPRNDRPTPQPLAAKIKASPQFVAEFVDATSESIDEFNITLNDGR